MLLDKGLIRVGIGIPRDAEFELIAADDPYRYASAAELSLFRRPLPATNLKFLTAVMWDGRETFADPASRDCILGTPSCFASIHFDLADQANGATVETDASGLPAATIEVSPLFGYDEDSFADAWNRLAPKPAVADGLYLV